MVKIINFFVRPESVMAFRETMRQLEYFQYVGYKINGYVPCANAWLFCVEEGSNVDLMICVVGMLDIF